jgi:acetoin utilization deacetylase AcuC-like enzyme
MLSGVGKLRNGTLTYQDILRLEIPYSRHMVEAFWLAAGGTILAARLALESGLGFNMAGGFHHAFPGHGEGFCAINDIAVAVRRLQRDGAIRRAMVVDCDVHHGNGTAAVFAGDESVFTLSIHQLNNYPTEKPPSSLDITPCRRHRRCRIPAKAGQRLSGGVDHVPSRTDDLRGGGRPLL